MKLEVLICTMEDRLDRIAQMLLPPDRDICYLVSCQYAQQEPAVPDALRQRTDVRVLFLKGKGLSHNRNNALRHALNEVLLIADDDCVLYADGLHGILKTYSEHPEVDIALFRVDGMSKFYPAHDFRFTEQDFLGAYCTASVEMTMRRSSLHGLMFNPHFGLGSEYLAAGEEQVFLSDALREGLHVHWFPLTIGRTPPGTTGERFLDDVRVQRSKGAAFCYLLGPQRACWKCIRESIHHFVYHHSNPFVLMQHMNDGIRYAKKLRK